MRARRASASSTCEQTRIERCLSFENRHNLFDIHARFKFALVVARRPGPTQAVRCAFYLTEFAQIDEPTRALDYDLAFIGALSGGPHATLLELRDRDRSLRWHDRCSSAAGNLARGQTGLGSFSQQGNAHDRRCRPFHVDLSPSAIA